MSTTFVVPTLGASTLLKEPGDIIAYQLRQFATTPKSLSTIYYDQVASLSDIISRAGDDSQKVIGPTTATLTGVFDRIFGTGASVVSVTAEQINATLYTLVISVQIRTSSQTYGISSTVSVVNGVIQLPNDTVPPLAA